MKLDPHPPFVIHDAQGAVFLRVAAPSAAQIEAALALGPADESAPETERARVARHLDETAILLTDPPESATVNAREDWERRQSAVRAKLAALPYRALLLIRDRAWLWAQGVPVDEIEAAAAALLEKKTAANPAWPAPSSAPTSAAS